MKQVIVLRKDLNMRKGKMVAQGAHASMKVLVDNPFNINIALWLSGLFTKICVSVDSEEELLDIVSKAIQMDVLCSLIKDSGKTEFNGIETHTAAAIGPDIPEKIDLITGHLKLL